MSDLYHEEILMELRRILMELRQLRNDIALTNATSPGFTGGGQPDEDELKAMLDAMIGKRINK